MFSLQVVILRKDHPQNNHKKTLYSFLRFVFLSGKQPRDANAKRLFYLAVVLSVDTRSDKILPVFSARAKSELHCDFIVLIGTAAKFHREICIRALRAQTGFSKRIGGKIENTNNQILTIFKLRVAITELYLFIGLFDFLA